jgi:hypothetical protein
VFGGITATVLPAFQAPDEPLHWWTAVGRSATLAGGDPTKLCGRVVELPYFLHFDRVRWQPGERMRLGFAPGLAGMGSRCVEERVPYGLVTTYPSVLIGYPIFGIGGDGVSAAVYYWFSRLLSGVLVALLLWRVIAAFAARAPTPGLASIAVLFVSPLFVQQSFAITADTVMNLYALSMVAVCLRAPKVVWFDLGCYVVLGVTATWTKPVIAPLVLVPVVWVLATHLEMWPRVRRTWRGWWLALREDRAGLILVTLSLILVISAFAAIPPLGGAYAPEGPAPARNPAAQQVFVQKNLGQALGTFLQSIRTFLTVKDLTGVLGWLDTPLPDAIIERWRRLVYGVVAFDVVFAIAVLAEGGFRHALRRVVGWLLTTGAILVGLVVSLGATAYAMFVTWTPVAATKVEGVQARYFFPTLIVGALCLAATRLSPGAPSQTPERGAAAVAIACLLGAVGLTLAIIAAHLYLTLWARYW